jgi:D-xylose 1-dehydrogenase (NADP+, D-xylono-1,5-lactone-forming)
MDKLRWGLLSTARINRAVIPPIRSSKRSELIAVASRETAKAEAYAKDWEIPRAYGSYAALLADPSIDAVFISLPNSLHVDWAVKCAEAGKQVLCEKPLALTTAEVDRMIDAARWNKVVIAEAFMYQHHPQTIKVLEMLKNEPIGEVLLIKGAFTFNLAKIRPDDVRMFPELGGGSIWDLGCYPISYTRLIAQAEPIEVFGWQVTGKSGVDEVFTGQLHFANGLLAQFDCGFRTPYRMALEIVGTNGSIELDHAYRPEGNNWIKLNRGDQVELIQSPEKNLYLGEIEDIEAAALDGQPQRISLEWSRGNVAVITALLESARTGKVVKI